MRSKKSSLGPILSFVEVAQNRGWKYVPCMIVQNGRRVCNPEAIRLNDGIYATIVSPDGVTKVALDHTLIYYHNGNVWRGDPTDVRQNLIIFAALVVEQSHRKSGHATHAMKKLLEIANDLNMVVMLEASPIQKFSSKTKNITQKKLIRWYKKLGFVAAYPNQGEQILCHPAPPVDTN
jgi:GNAT superfamily N-acetyltransferase